MMDFIQNCYNKCIHYWVSNHYNSRWLILQVHKINACIFKINLYLKRGMTVYHYRDVFYSVGTNKAVFAIIKYHSLLFDDGALIPNSLCERLSRQPELNDCLNSDQVMAWNEQPSAVHIDRLVELAHTTGTPKHNTCNIL